MCLETGGRVTCHFFNRPCMVVDLPALPAQLWQVLRPLISGTVSLSGVELKAGDGAAISDETSLALTATDTAEFLLFDLA